MAENRLLLRGYVLIAAGLLIIVAAQLWATLPVVSAMALVGRGAVLLIQAGPRTGRQESLIVVNFMIYGSLVGLAIVAQSNAVLQDSATRASLSMLLDHAFAIVLLLGLGIHVFFRLCQPTA